MLTVKIPANVNYKTIGSYLFLKSDTKVEYLFIPEDISVEVLNGILYVRSIYLNSSKIKTIYSHIQNILAGFDVPYKKLLHLKGIGYKCTIADRQLQLKIGYSNIVSVPIPLGVSVFVDESQSIISLESTNIEKLTSFCTSVKRLRKKDVYKGKGIYYSEEQQYLKERKK